MLGSALKFCRVAEGGADIYPRLAPTCEWDVAAGHAIVAAAGGAVTRRSGRARCSLWTPGRDTAFRRAGLHRLGRSRRGGVTTTAASGAIEIDPADSILRARPCPAPASAPSPRAGSAPDRRRRHRRLSSPAEQIEPLPGNQPELRVAGIGDAAGDVDRVVAAELRGSRRPGWATNAARLPSLRKRQTAPASDASKSGRPGSARASAK